MARTNVALPQLSLGDLLSTAERKPKESIPFGERIARILGLRMDARTSFFLVVYGAAAADGRISEEEATELDALMSRSPTLSKLSAERRAKLMRKYHARLMDAGRRRSLLSRAARSVPAKKRLSAFAHAVDIILGDRVVLPSERAFISDMVGLLELDEASATAILNALRKKNDH
ncbi:tellurite resistance TerB family protein [Hyphomonas sp.]|uniref:tellurite resistance TerB family protein n=1 Tax=Hyphomonas sp. TaxID=87 RepID=UPI00391AB488